MPSKIKKLEDYFNSRPDQDRLAEMLQFYTTTIDKIETEHQNFDQATRKVSTLRVVDEKEKLLESELINLHMSVNKSLGKLSSLVPTGKIQVLRDDKSMASISVSIGSLNSKIEDEWTRLSSDISEKSRTFKLLIEKTDPSKVPEFNKISSSLEKTKSVPLEEAEVNEFMRLKESLSAFITSFKVVGVVGKFLKDCSEGNGDPKDLEHKEVKEFLIANSGIWKYLKIQLK